MGYFLKTDTARGKSSHFLRGSNGNSGAIVGTATYTPTNSADTNAPGQHGVMLLPCQFRLLNGDTNAADVDGVDFSGNRPTTISATSNYASSTMIANAESANQTNFIGADIPLGVGRSDASGQVDTYSLMMLAQVSPPAATNITYGWNRVYQDRSVAIIKVITSTNSYWYVKSVNHDQTSPTDFKFPTGFPTNNPDLDGGGYHTSAPSTNGNIVAIYDDPGMNLGYYTNFTSAYTGWFSTFTTNTSFHVGDYAYQKRHFTYSLTNAIGSAYAVGTMNVGTILVAQKTGTNNVVATDWTNIINVASTTNIPDCSQITTNEISAIVSPSTNIIVLDPHVNDPDPNP